VRPIAPGQSLPELHYPASFLPPNTDAAILSHPGADKTGPVQGIPRADNVPYEMLVPKQGQTAAAPPVLQLMPMPQVAPPANPNPGLSAPPVGGAAANPGPGK
jgi:hypothetical protein